MQRVPRFPVHRVSTLKGHVSSGVAFNTSSAVSKCVELFVEPLSCLHDEPVSIRVRGLTPDQDVTLQASMNDIRGVHYLSYAHYRSNDCGEVDASVMESSGGHYKGIYPMGLIGSLSSAPDKSKYTRFFKRDVENPSIVNLSVHNGHLATKELCSSDTKEPLASITHLRHYMAPGVQRIPVRTGRVRGCLFLPPGDGPFPGVVDMFGTAGGLIEYRSAQLASRGFASLALAYLGYDDLPKLLEKFDIAYFEEAVELLLKHEKVLKPHVGAIGVSKGADLALSLATFIPEVKAAVWINGCSANVQASLHLHDRTIPGLDFELSRGEFKDGVLDTYEMLNDPLDYPETVIPIETADAHFLFLAGCDDRNWKSEVYVDQAIDRLRRANMNNYEVHKYPETGHLIEPPYSPHCPASYHKMIGMPLIWGGATVPHLKSQEHSWSATLNFLRTYIH